MDKLGLENIAYCDTDSIITTKPPNEEFIKNFMTTEEKQELGKFKDEYPK